MGQLLDVALLPHPPLMVPEIGRGQIDTISATVEATRELAARVAASRPEVIIIISPHGPVFRDAVGLWATPQLTGDLAAFAAGEVRFSYDLDLDLSRFIAQEAEKAGVAVAWLDGEGSRRYGLTPELDHGMMVPLYYLRQAGLDLPLVAMGMAFLERKSLYAFGTALARAVKASSKRVLLVASGDLSHRLTPGAPAGYEPEGKVFDLKLRDLLANLDIPGILAIPEELAEKAAECGLRSFIMALGALEGYKLKGEVLSYEGPFGVGYLVAHLQPDQERAQDSLLAANAESAAVRLARRSLEYYLQTGKVLPLPEEIEPELKGRAGAFVSLKKQGQLRGCIGTIEATRENLAAEIIHNALAAGLEDPRFASVTLEELPELEYSVDVLGKPEPATLADLDPQVYGVIVSKGWRRGLLLPALEGVDTVEEQVNIACRKAGIDPRESYRLERFKVTRYR
ncbi:MAG: AmmeMemoRadiSam system protein A [Clostridia bacterium]|nr:AmmeMemoRadiSam system protein A [Clostridia bacterium]